MSLLQEIQAAATDGTTDLETLLRKCRILASRLKNNDLKNWVQWELDGYPHDVNLPEYRIISCQSFGQFLGAFGRQLNNAPIPGNCIPSEARDVLTSIKMRQGVGSLKSIENTSESGAVRFALPADLNAIIGDRIYEGFVLALGWRMISVDAIDGILSTIRNRVLNFTLV